MKRVWPVLLASGLGLALLVWLGFWQLERLAWKQALIENIDEKANGNAMPLADVLMRLGKDENLEYQRVMSFSGTCIKGAYVRLLATYEGLASHRIFQACEFLNSGSALIVDMGLVPDYVGDAWQKSIEEFTLPDEPDRFLLDVEGVMRFPLSRRGYFDPENDVQKNQWYWWDEAAIRQALQAKMPKDVDLAMIVVQQVPGAQNHDWPRPQPPKINLRNNHLGYAITWFGLAAVLVVMTGLFLYQNRHSKRARNKVE
jgi:surfeit locus 1 family protein